MRIIARQSREIAELRRQQRGRSREGAVTQVDAARGLVRVDVGREGSPLLTGWIPVRTQAAGALAIQADPVVGERVRVTSESGDLTDAVVDGSLYNDAETARPHNVAGELMIAKGDASVLVTASAIKLTVGATSITVTAGGVSFGGGSLTHDGTNVGKTHVHGGVTSGPANTSPPS